ncbi:ABC-type multidrug transport system, permease component [Magnetospirillum sp. LM-5]|uniref:ABC transporter permease n=1 Tax=Magnetospirillum sp. LM-5 TaxID=2681466 RepID=UPI00137DE35D|nr:ABC transporter permease [Magnetospirillum sp. LM-5]CAA7621328.1 ABC-type multidrug transport system, permease component [Magnetospirillum sp. LM-5]
MTHFSFRRVGALLLRHLYIMRGSWPRLLEMAYWPAVNMVVWGFTSQFFAGHSDWVAKAGGILIGAVLLWDVMFRGNLGVALSFMEEMWSRNLGHLSVSPLRPIELVAGLVAMSLVRTLIGVLPAMLLAIPLYHYSIFEMGPALITFWANLMVSGWAIGLAVSAMVLRFGLGVESLAWVMVFAVAPLAGIYYPVETLPAWLQPVAWALPPAHVFDGMRTLMQTGLFDWSRLLQAVGLNLLYVAAAAALFLRTHHVARQRGLLLNVGE